jgi:hypothetical protein
MLVVIRAECFLIVMLRPGTVSNGYINDWSTIFDRFSLKLKVIKLLVFPVLNLPPLADQLTTYTGGCGRSGTVSPSFRLFFLLSILYNFLFMSLAKKPNKQQYSSMANAFQTSSIFASKPGRYQSGPALDKLLKRLANDKHYSLLSVFVSDESF